MLEAADLDGLVSLHMRPESHAGLLRFEAHAVAISLHYVAVQ